MHCCIPVPSRDGRSSTGSGTMRAGRLGPRSSRCLVALVVLCGMTALGSGRQSLAADVEKGADATKRGAPTKLALIDQRLKEMWEQSSIKPSPICSDEEFLRRAYLDILGRIPTIKEAAGVPPDEGVGQAAEAGRIPAQPPRLRQELRQPVDGPPDRPEDAGAARSTAARCRPGCGSSSTPTGPGTRSSTS